jgi:hypothetical protein
VGEILMTTASPSRRLWQRNSEGEDVTYTVR